MTTVKNIYDYINSIAPFETQEEWDNSGHLIGNFRKEVKKCVMALDATKEVCLFAKEIGADLVLTHHPIIFGTIDSVKSGTAVYTLASSDIACISAHTNFDLAHGGINDNLAGILGLKNARHIDNSFLVAGELEYEMSIYDFAEFVSDKLDCRGLRYTKTDETIKTVALGGGACEDEWEIAMQNADCFLTGDMKYHKMLDAAEEGFAVISAGHFETENKAFLMLREKLEKLFTDVDFIAAPRENPIQTVD
ncbi:MAG: Nif3-like dinuclear metal center hexameric protein [Eubacterium sp.]|nr:Nif3-like dinuclear metal center hexameric protein [Eubacterium sp.]